MSGMEQVPMDAGIEFAVQQLISKVESSQVIIDDLESQVLDLKEKLEAKDIELKRIVEFEFEVKFSKLQEELDYYYSLSRKQLELIQASEDLQARAARLLLGSDHWIGPLNGLTTRSNKKAGKGAGLRRGEVDLCLDQAEPTPV